MYIYTISYIRHVKVSWFFIVNSSPNGKGVTSIHVALASIKMCMAIFRLLLYDVCLFDELKLLYFYVQ